MLAMLLVRFLLASNLLKLTVLACLLVGSIGLFIAAPHLRAATENNVVAKKHAAKIPFPIYLPPASSQWTQPRDIIISTTSETDNATLVDVEAADYPFDGGDGDYQQNYANLNFVAATPNLKLAASKHGDCKGHTKDMFGDPIGYSCQLYYDANGIKIY
ncbi:MAG TPA: hypothetical protein VFL85_05165, partial [Candidatus Saccharimonadales bacterium]|nr:hypothetical protein [Candidatus Saccharimonadales bacterium]